MTVLAQDTPFGPCPHGLRWPDPCRECEDADPMSARTWLAEEQAARESARRRETRDSSIQVWHRDNAGKLTGWWVALRGTCTSPEHGPFGTEDEADAFGRQLLRIENERLRYLGAAV